MNQELCMTTSSPDWLESVHRKLKKPLARSERLRLGLLCMANAVGSLLVLLPALVCLSASASALYFGQQLNGPLDWFLFELLGGAALLSGIVAIDLLFTRPDVDSGIPVSREQSPELFAMLERRLAHFKLENCDQARLDDGTDLRIDASPRWLLPVGHRRRPQLGAALLFFLSPAQFRLALAAAVAAHAGTRRNVRSWLAQSRQDWKLIHEALCRRNSISSRILRRPVDWITVLVALLGRELDNHDQQMQYRWLRENSDETTAGELLATRTVADAYLTRQYWPMIMKAADHCAQPVVHPFGHFQLLLQRTLQAADARRWLLRAQSGSADHCDLLAELGIEHLTWSGIPADNTFDTLFANNDMLERLDCYWRKQIETHWNQRHQQSLEKQQRFEKLQALAKQGALHGHAALRYVKLAANLLDREQAIETWQSTCAANFNDANVCLACGRSLLAADASDAGWKALERAAELDPSLTRSVRRLIREHGINRSPVPAGAVS